MELIEIDDLATEDAFRISFSVIEKFQTFDLESSEIKNFLSNAYIPFV